MASYRQSPHLCLSIKKTCLHGRITNVALFVPVLESLCADAEAHPGAEGVLVPAEGVRIQRGYDAVRGLK